MALHTGYLPRSHQTVLGQRRAAATQRRMDAVRRQSRLQAVNGAASTANARLRLAGYFVLGLTGVTAIGGMIG